MRRVFIAIGILFFTITFCNQGYSYETVSSHNFYLHINHVSKYFQTRTNLSEKEPEKKLTKTKGFYGISLGQPAELNMVLISYANNRIGIRMSGMFRGIGLSTEIKNIYGFQLNILFKLGEWRQFLHNFSIVMGIAEKEFEELAGWDSTSWKHDTRIEKISVKYFGIAYDFVLGPLFLEVNYLFKKDGDWESYPDITKQFGLVFKF